MPKSAQTRASSNRIEIIVPMAQNIFVKSGGNIRGPFTSSQIKQFAAKSKIKPTTLLRSGETGKWTEARKVRGLFPPVQEPTEDQHRADEPKPVFVASLAKTSSDVSAQNEQPPPDGAPIPFRTFGETSPTPSPQPEQVSQPIQVSQPAPVSQRDPAPAIRPVQTSQPIQVSQQPTQDLQPVSVFDTGPTQPGTPAIDLEKRSSERSSGKGAAKSGGLNLHPRNLLTGNFFLLIFAVLFYYFSFAAFTDPHFIDGAEAGGRNAGTKMLVLKFWGWPVGVVCLLIGTFFLIAAFSEPDEVSS